MSFRAAQTARNPLPKRDGDPSRSSALGMTCLAFLFALPALAVSPPDASRAARDYRTRHEREIVTEFMQLLAIPNLASDSANIERNAAAISAMLTRRGADVKLLRIEGAPPLIYATLPARNAKSTIAFYAHYDGQPVDPAQWTSPPWQPVMRGEGGEARIYARSASDDKAPIMAMLAALDALKAIRAAPSVNLKFVFEGEEEAGSPHLGAYFDRYPKELSADAWLLCDGPVHQSRHMQLYFGARGVTDLDLTVYGPLRPL